MTCYLSLVSEALQVWKVGRVHTSGQLSLQGICTSLNFRQPCSLTVDIDMWTAEQHRSILDVRPAKFFQVAVGLSSLEEATVFSRYTTSRDHSDLFRNEQESLSARVVLDAKVAISKSALSVRISTTSCPECVDRPG